MLRTIRILSATLAVAAVMALGLSATQADDTTDTAWQQVITSQIQAFRDHDAAVAFSYAGAPFQKSFATPEDFFAAIIGSGYSPIMESRSHSFGKFQMMSDTSVMQEVDLLGGDQGLYQAFYELDQESDGWRVEGVVLQKTEGMGI